MKEEKRIGIRKRTVLKSCTPPLARCYQAGKIKLYEHNYSPKKQRVYPCLSQKFLFGWETSHVTGEFSKCWYVESIKPLLKFQLYKKSS